MYDRLQYVQCMITHDTGYSVMLNTMYPVLVISVLTPVALKTFGQLALHTVVCVLISFPFGSLHVSHFFFFSYLAPIIIPALRSSSVSPGQSIFSVAERRVQLLSSAAGRRCSPLNVNTEGFGSACSPAGFKMR